MGQGLLAHIFVIVRGWVYIERVPLEIKDIQTSGRTQVSDAGGYIGRAADSLIRIDDPKVADKHAQLKLENGRWYLVDLGATALEAMTKLRGEEHLRFTVGRRGETVTLTVDVAPAK